MSNRNNLPIYFSIAVVLGIIIGISLNGNSSNMLSLTKNSSQELKIKRDSRNNMMEKLNQCPVCNSTKLSKAFDCVDHFLSKETFELDRCSNCNTLLTNPRPDQENQ